MEFSHSLHVFQYINPISSGHILLNIFLVLLWKFVIVLEVKKKELSGKVSGEILNIWLIGVVPSIWSWLDHEAPYWPLDLVVCATIR